jgi:hypothetical protein
MIVVLDDFRSAAAVAQRWSAFSDRVMGGMSIAHAGLAEVQGQPSLRLTGRVSLENNGGFVQVARQLDDLDASAFSGVQLRVCGAPGSYFVHLRTGDTRAPWQYYGAPLPVTATWADVYLPWSSFKPVSLAAPLDVRRLMRIGLVAAKTAFDADLAISRLELVP